MRSVRWAVWSPALGTGDTDVVLPLRGGACRGPCQALVYRTPPNSRQVRVCWLLCLRHQGQGAAVGGTREAACNTLSESIFVANFRGSTWSLGLSNSMFPLIRKNIL